MDSIKLKSAEELHTRLTVEDHWNLFPSLIDCIDLVIKEAQRNAIEFTLQQVGKNAEIEEKFISTGDYTGHMRTQVNKSSILNLKETIYKENNL